MSDLNINESGIMERLKVSNANKKIMRYAVWNNKGGVGKTFLSFMMAGEYAQHNKDKNVVLIDLCPQANASEIALGGNGTGSNTLKQLLEQTPNRLTIGGYFDERIASPYKATGTEASYLVNPKSSGFNKNVEKNLYIVAGDPSLELQAQVINQLSILPQPPGAWKLVHSWVLDLISGIEEKLGKETMFFIDCNPSFASYTELAILASERLIVPCSGDGSSARAIDNLGRLIYGIETPSRYAKGNFNALAKEHKFELPKVHIIALNRSTQYGKSASNAFSAMFDEIKTRTDNLRAKDKTIFTPEFEFLDIPDSHTLSIICSHLGMPISELTAETKYRVNGKNTAVKKISYDTYMSAIDSMISRL